MAGGKPFWIGRDNSHNRSKLFLLLAAFVGFGGHLLQNGGIERVVRLVDAGIAQHAHAGNGADGLNVGRINFFGL